MNHLSEQEEVAQNNTHFGCKALSCDVDIKLISEGDFFDGEVGTLITLLQQPRVCFYRHWEKSITHPVSVIFGRMWI